MAAGHGSGCGAWCKRAEHPLRFPLRVFLIVDGNAWASAASERADWLESEVGLVRGLARLQSALCIVTSCARRRERADSERAGSYITKCG